jgi:hypothetical protein
VERWGARQRHADRKISYPLAGDKRRLDALVYDCNTPQKHVLWSEIDLLTADSVGTG